MAQVLLAPGHLALRPLLPLPLAPLLTPIPKLSLEHLSLVILFWWHESVYGSASLLVSGHLPELDSVAFILVSGTCNTKHAAMVEWMNKCMHTEVLCALDSRNYFWKAGCEKEIELYLKEGQYFTRLRDPRWYFFPRVTHLVSSCLVGFDRKRRLEWN